MEINLLGSVSAIGASSHGFEAAMKVGDLKLAIKCYLIGRLGCVVLPEGVES